MKFLQFALLLACAALVSAAAPPSARQPRLSGRTWHCAVCKVTARGAVRCHARIVTTATGQVITNVRKPDATPAGFGPADLRAAYGITGDGAATTTIAIVDAYGYQN